jgi:hypothetical protein
MPLPSSRIAVAPTKSRRTGLTSSGCVQPMLCGPPSTRTSVQSAVSAGSRRGGAEAEDPSAECVLGIATSCKPLLGLPGISVPRPGGCANACDAQPSTAVARPGQLPLIARCRPQPLLMPAGRQRVFGGSSGRAVSPRDRSRPARFRCQRVCGHRRFRPTRSRWPRGRVRPRSRRVRSRRTGRCGCPA